VGASIFSYNVTSEDVPVCTLLLITIAACSTVGRGDSQTVVAALPDGEGFFYREV